MKKWLKILFIILLFAGISVGLYFLLAALNITNIGTLRKIITSSGHYAIISYITITTLLLTFLCFVPLLNSGLIVLAIVLFKPEIAFILILSSTLLSNTLLFFIGRFCKKFAKKLIKEADFNEIQVKITQKSKILLPILFILPGIPDESLCLVAGITNMKYWYLLLISTIYHSIEIGLFCFFGSGLIDWSTLTILDWIILLNVLVFDTAWLFKLEKKFK